ncbi:hypothetical protein S7711_08947 [Stachybotrys chartarum IBT 7711]|uniref:BZIP domain-containing protein n=1 Tax=Stachybotrys chartarum (strain CBS 109288 / IBT 7711) TaxID=1280523 RepID=A0A084AI19_STACB|nr:hypothetical protein S7711_08947 [Stachybotrys chartarum IBT 7711]KFA49629.1 hypothetical protein S40293_10212 [Stachybotrys chartarum IBT 40293]KFA72516.1 hypothetical protein S40288_07855 [Stachybotrys chartarum IBT 40288]
MESYYRSNSLTVDTKHAQKMFEDPDNSVLDDGVLDHSTIDSALELSPPMHDSRRDSFAVGAPLFSPKTEDWGQGADMQSLPSNNPFATAHSNNPYRPNQTQQFVSSTNPWPMENAAGNFFQSFDPMPTDFDANASIIQRAMHAQTPFTTPSNMFGGFGAGTQSIPASPQKDWVSINHAMNKKMQPGSPVIRSHNELRRGDGIRKKNARFEIPAERNLGNIDRLIAQSTCEQEIKELKQQKRLLRNRQAALDSRQRKKQHTERLEDEKKQFTTIMSDLEEDLNMWKTKYETLMMEHTNAVQCIETLVNEKDELIRAHTLESGELRKKNNVLVEHIHRLESNHAQPSNTSNGVFPSHPFDEMEGMAATGAWDNNHGFVNEYTVEPESMQSEMTLVPAKRNNTSALGVEGDKGASQGGLLFMLFLVGAFVMSSRSAPPPLAVSEDVRVASATLLDNVLKDAGINSQSNGIRSLAPQPSGTAWANPPAASMHANDMAVDSVAPSMLTDLGNSLTQPTEEQTNEQLFSLSAAQYNGVNDQHFMQNPPERTTSQGRKNLADALAAMRGTNKQNGAAEVYTRSLLWDQIPNEVVRKFAKMVAECNNPQNQQQCNEAVA